MLDASGKTLGKIAAEAACLLMGKNKPIFSRHIDVGDNVVIINATKLRLSGNKTDTKVYYHHSGYPGGLKAETFNKLVQTKPERIIEHAVKGMLPRNKLGKTMITKLRVYPDEKHPHLSQLRQESKGNEEKHG
jgi:large subunit ribosomal protein L13